MAAPYMAQTYGGRETMEIRLPINSAPSETVPYDLQQYYTKEVWVARQRAILLKGSRYLKPRFEVIWTVFIALSVVAVPIAVYYVLLNTLPEGQQFEEFVDGGRFVSNESDRYWQARAASFGVLFAVLLVGFLPILVWKHVGKNRVNAMLRKFSEEDRAMRGPNADVPVWGIKMPGLGKSALNLTITYAAPPRTTAFRPGSQLPPYIASAPADPAVAAYYAGYLNAQPQSQGQGLPLFNDRDEKVPDYTGPTGDIYTPGDEKNPFEDVKPLTSDIVRSILLVSAVGRFVAFVDMECVQVPAGVCLPINCIKITFELNLLLLP
ncbi:hypothetical protein A0H81_12853 [Grifola frondosa]|uniref:Uncharacterized protein n=1 Tax=Grifola frondosa TaxID=5627 RepID=A0A1C7LWN8_GRIFR|nr:hypothetical protein A0H81_12853 [Grifola frondosa]